MKQQKNNRSIIIVAHPDDEILWLSSILGRVDKIVFCFQDCASAPKLGPGRSRLLAEYPISNCVNLGIEESLSFNMADWESPRVTDYGLHIAKNSRASTKYRRNYLDLIEKLAPILEDYDNVYTHNPWGEYGHEDHVQVYRVIKTLQKGMNNNIWFSNYCSQQSMKLMLEYISGFSNDYITLPTNIGLAHTLRDLYKKHECWTWYDDYQWFREESLMTDASLDDSGLPRGHIFPINMLKTDFTSKPKKSGRFPRLLRKMVGNPHQ